MRQALLVSLYSASRYLLGDGAVAVLLQPVQLVGLPQQRVEGLGRAVDRGGVGGDGEGGHQAHLLQRGVAASGPVQELAVLQVLAQALQHGQRLVEVHLRIGREGSSMPHAIVTPGRGLSPSLYRHGNLGQVFADAVLHDAPQVEGVVWLVGDAAAPRPARLQVICAGGVLQKHRTKASACDAQERGRI